MNQQDHSDFVRFWGVRGSIPSPGPRTSAVGGNTTCVEVSLGGQRIIIDGGSGLRQLGAARGGRPLAATLLFTHLHWDHIQGLPFFAPLYDARSELTLLGPAGLAEALEQQMSKPTFPVGTDVFAANWNARTMQTDAPFALGDVQVSTIALRHPGGCIGYALECDGRRLVHCCDYEHAAQGLDADVVDFAQGADVLIYDAQYLPEEYPRRRGWGHSTWEQGVELARAAAVSQLVLTHHDPNRDDAGVLEIEQRTRRCFSDSWAAREGLTLPLAAPRPRRQPAHERHHLQLV